ncbi:hypothetical protein [Salipaludibacillus daqingensis]|nr:hypothetical protein [Salipaludibacillus daqingensis]
MWFKHFIFVIAVLTDGYLDMCAYSDAVLLNEEPHRYLYNKYSYFLTT